MGNPGRLRAEGPTRPVVQPAAPNKVALWLLPEESPATVPAPSSKAELVLEAAPAGEIQGKLNTGAYGTLTVFGSVGYGSPFSIRIQAVGKDKGSPSEGWIYDYIGWLIPAWPNGVDQRRSILGSVIRTVPHSNGQFKAGEVASFIAVKKD
jgi:hypothetical protein